MSGCVIMRSQWRAFLEFVRNRGDVPFLDAGEQKAEEAYEEARQRLYELHLQAKNLFYVDSAVTEKNMHSGEMTGEVAKGSFAVGDCVKLLDGSGIFLMEARIIEKKEEESALKGIMRGDVKSILTLSWEETSGTEELFLQVQFLQRK